MIIVSEDQTAAMRAHGVRDYPYECCGLMLGKFGAGRKRLSRLSQAFWRLVAASIDWGLIFSAVSQHLMASRKSSAA